VAALLTIFIVAIVDQLLPPPLNSPLTPAAIVGGVLIIGAFLLLSWATYKVGRLDVFYSITGFGWHHLISNDIMILPVCIVLLSTVGYSFITTI
jgi:hypothetical protein